jgi:hypothetical protein
MRVLSACVAFLVLAAPVPQSSFDLHARYGEPDVQRFAIRPDITLTVEYGSDHKACILDVAPRQAFVHAFFGGQASFSKEAALELLDEVATPEVRGTEETSLFSNMFQSSCGAGTVGVWKNAQVSMSLNVCKAPVTVQSLRVSLTRSACEPLTKWNSP